MKLKREIARQMLGDILSPFYSDQPPPNIIIAAGDAARFAWEEFLFGCLPNPHTRRAYPAAAWHIMQRMNPDLSQAV